MRYYFYYNDKCLGSYVGDSEDDAFHDKIRQIEKSKKLKGKQIDIFILKNGKLEWESSHLTCPAIV